MEGSTVCICELYLLLPGTWSFITLFDPAPASTGMRYQRIELMN